MDKKVPIRRTKRFPLITESISTIPKILVTNSSWIMEKPKKAVMMPKTKALADNLIIS